MDLRLFDFPRHIQTSNGPIKQPSPPLNTPNSSNDPPSSFQQVFPIQLLLQKAFTNFTLISDTIMDPLIIKHLVRIIL